MKVYDGLEENPRRLLRVLTAFDSRAPVAVVSSSGQLRVHFYADKINAARGFNVTYQVCWIGFSDFLSVLNTFMVLSHFRENRWVLFNQFLCSAVRMYFRWMGSAFPGRFPVEGTGAVTLNSSAVTGTGTVPMAGMS